MTLIPIRLSVTTCYLIRTGEKYLLVDTGYEEDGALFRAGLKKTGVKAGDITHIILTHHHDDHCGLIRDIVAENPAVRVVMSRLCGGLIARGENDKTHGGGLLNRRVAFLTRNKRLFLELKLRKRIPKEKNLKFTPYIARDNDILLDNDTRLSDIGIPLDGMILFTPGHTVDSISVLFDNGDLLAGDAAADMLKLAGTKNCVIFVCDLEEYYRSWKKLIAAGAGMVYPAHGRPFPVGRLEKNLGKNKPEDIVKM